METKMKVIMPCAGSSSRFPNMRPKWMLTHPNGDLMIKQAFECLKGIQKKDLIITILKEHEEKYDIVKGLKENIGKEVQVVILDEPTKSQSETVFKTIQKTGLNEPFLVKDSDNYFSVDVSQSDKNYVCYSSLDEYDEINAKNKSYIVMNDQGIIINIVEKKIVSQHFNVGGYFFKDPQKFAKTFEKLSKNNGSSEIYISNIIEDMILNEKEVFLGKKVTNYHDWGTLEDWRFYCQKFKTYFFDLDGIFFENSAQYFKPRWEDAKFIEDNVKFLKELSDNPYMQIYLVTSRSESYRKMLEEKFSKLGIKYQQLIMGVQHSKRIIVNDFADTNRYPSCEAINIPRNSENLRKYLDNGKKGN